MGGTVMQIDIESACVVLERSKMDQSLCLSVTMGGERNPLQTNVPLSTR
jgi:hypothetical protein